MEITVTDSNAQDFFSSELPLVLDFWATWCGPCRQIAPSISELAEEYDGRILVGKCDIEDATELTEKYNILNIPTVLFIKNGEVTDKFIGSMPKASIKEKFEKLL